MTMHPPETLEPAESPLTPDSWGKLGMWVFLAGDAAGFGVLLASYGAIRVSSTDWPVPSQHFGIQLTAFMTFLLICSSVTMVKSLEAIKAEARGRMKLFLFLTVRSEEHTSELQSQSNIVCRLLLGKKQECLEGEPDCSPPGPCAAQTSAAGCR